MYLKIFFWLYFIELLRDCQNNFSNLKKLIIKFIFWVKILFNIIKFLRYCLLSISTIQSYQHQIPVMLIWVLECQAMLMISLEKWFFGWKFAIWQVSYPAEVFEDAGNFMLPPEIGNDAQYCHQYNRSEHHVFPHGQHQLHKTTSTTDAINCLNFNNEEKSGEISANFINCENQPTKPQWIVQQICKFIDGISSD